MAPVEARTTPKYTNQKVDDELFSLLRHAANYDLFDFNERLRSHHDLVRLFNSLIDVFKPDLFVEAGAFWAEASRDIKRRLPQTRVVAFEANPYNYEMCTAQVDYKAAGVEYVHTALSSKPGDVTFKVPTSKNNEPMDKTMGRASILERTDAKFTYELVTVPGTTLDAFFGEAKPRSCAAWIDVEGASHLVLSGGEGLFSSTDIVFIEVEDRQLWDGQWVTRDVARFFARFGLLPLARDFESPSRVQYNIIFLRDRLRQDHRVWRYLSEFHSAAAHPKIKLFANDHA